jgi:hypothetical protein
MWFSRMWRHVTVTNYSIELDASIFRLILPKHWSPSTELHGFAFHMTKVLTVPALRISNFIYEIENCYVQLLYLKNCQENWGDRKEPAPISQNAHYNLWNQLWSFERCSDFLWVRATKYSRGRFTRLKGDGCIQKGNGSEYQLRIVPLYMEISCKIGAWDWTGTQNNSNFVQNFKQHSPCTNVIYKNALQDKIFAQNLAQSSKRYQSSEIHVVHITQVAWK